VIKPGLPKNGPTILFLRDCQVNARKKGRALKEPARKVICKKRARESNPRALKEDLRCLPI
jgi:hypothetical protein